MKLNSLNQPFYRHRDVKKSHLFSFLRIIVFLLQKAQQVFLYKMKIICPFKHLKLFSLCEKTFKSLASPLHVVKRVSAHALDFDVKYSFVKILFTWIRTHDGKTRGSGSRSLLHNVRERLRFAKKMEFF